MKKIKNICALINTATGGVLLFGMIAIFGAVMIMVIYIPGYKWRV